MPCEVGVSRRVPAASRRHPSVGVRFAPTRHDPRAAESPHDGFDPLFTDAN